MSFSYTLPFAGDRDKLRFLINDRVNIGHAFEDEELDGVLALESNDLQSARLECLMTLLVDTTRFMKWTQSQNSVDKSKAYDALKAAIEEVRAQIVVDETSAGEVVDYHKNDIDYYGVLLDPKNNI